MLHGMQVTGGPITLFEHVSVFEFSADGVGGERGGTVSSGMGAAGLGLVFTFKSFAGGGGDAGAFQKVFNIFD